MNLCPPDVVVPQFASGRGGELPAWAACRAGSPRNVTAALFVLILLGIGPPELEAATTLPNVLLNEVAARGSHFEYSGRFSAAGGRKFYRVVKR